MSLRFPRSIHRRRTGGVLGLLAALVLGLVAGALELVPVASQTVTLEAVRAPGPIDESDPWATVWEAAPAQAVPLSAQKVAPPFGGGTVSAITARALHDGQRLFLLVEWQDTAVNDTVNDSQAFADAAAVQFPADPTQPLPPFTMGGPNAHVNIWQWKALWQADAERGFSTTLSRYPNTYTDYYPGGEDTLYKPALHVGNPLAQRDRESPVENLVARGFGTLTHADVQDVGGAGVWREGRWRVLFARDFEPGAGSLAQFAPGQTTSVAFAVWDGGAGDRNGQKSIASWIELAIGDGEAAAAGAEGEGGGGGLLIALFVAVVAVAVGAYLLAVRQQRREAG